MSSESAPSAASLTAENVGKAVPKHPYRVWWMPQVPMKAFLVEVPDLTMAASVMDVLAEYDKFQFDNRVKPDYSNAGGIVVWDEEAGEWSDVDESAMLGPDVDEDSVALVVEDE